MHRVIGTATRRFRRIVALRGVCRRRRARSAKSSSALLVTSVATQNNVPLGTGGLGEDAGLTELANDVVSCGLGEPCGLLDECGGDGQLAEERDRTCPDRGGSSDGDRL